MQTPGSRPLAPGSWPLALAPGSRPLALGSCNHNNSLHEGEKGGIANYFMGRHWWKTTASHFAPGKADYCGIYS